MNKTVVVYSSLTGNTKKVAEVIYDIIDGEKAIYSVDEISHECLQSYSRFIFGFWVDKGTANSKIRKMLSKIENKEVAFFGTLGAKPESAHGQKVYRRLTELCSKKNTLLGGFLCRGKVDEKLVEKMKKFPLNIIHPLTPERTERIESAKSHPNEKDFEDAKKYFKSIL